MRRAVAAALLVLVAGPAVAQISALPPLQAPGTSPVAPAQPAPPAAPAWLPRTTAELVALDRISAKSITLTLTIGQVARFHTLSIALHACDVRPPDQAPDATAFLDITDSKVGAPEFHGWLIRSAPSVSSLQSPLYDVGLLGCR